MKFLAHNIKYDIDMREPADREKGLQFFKYRNKDKMPFLNSLLCIYSKVKGFDEMTLTDVQRELKLTTGESFGKVMEDMQKGDGEGAFAFTHFDPINNFFTIKVNWELIEKTHEANPEFVSFLLLHQVCHSYFGHFTREVIQSYRDRNGALTEMILDAQVNSFLIRALGYKNSKDIYRKKTLEFVEEKFATFEKLFAWSGEEYNITADFDTEEDFPSIVSIFNKMDHLFDMQNLINLERVGAGLDNHSASMVSTEATALELNKPVAQLSRMQNDSMEYLQETARQEGFGASDALRRQTEAEYSKKSILEIVKLRTILGKISKANRKKTYKRVNRRRSYPGDIPMKGTVPYGINHIVVGMDVSGSVSNEEVTMVKSHLKTFAKKHKDDVVIDFFVWSSGTIDPDRDLVENCSDQKLNDFDYYSYGGTELSYVNSFIADHYEGQEIVFVNITDGYYNHREMPLDIITDHYGILTVEGMVDSYEQMHKNDNLRQIEVIRAERRVN